MIGDLVQHVRPASVLGGIGRRTLAGVGGLGRFVLFCGGAMLSVGRRPVRVRVILEHLHFFGN